MTKFRALRLLVLIVDVCLLLSMTPTDGYTQQRRPIAKEGLLKALEIKSLTRKELIREVELRGVSFQLTSIDEQEIRRAGKNLGKKGLDDLIAAVLNNYRVDSSQQPTATPSPTSKQSELRAFLTPANDPTPTNECGDILKPNLKALFLGGSVIAFGKDQKQFSVVTMGDEDLLTVENTSGGLVLSGTIRDQDNHIVATIKKNVFHSYGGSRYEARSDDQHSILVLDPNDEIVLYIRYVNPQAIKVLGTFRAPNKPTVTIEEGKILIGKGQIGVMCSVNDAPEGSWMQLKAAIKIA